MKQRLKGLICGWLVLVMLVGMLATPAMASPSNSIYLYTGTSPLKAGDSFSKWERPTVSEDTLLSSLITNTPDGATLTGWNLWKFGTVNSGYVIVEKLLTKDAAWKLSADDVGTYANGDYYAFEPLYAYSANIDVYIGEDALYSNSIYSDDMEERQIALNSALSEQDVLSDLATNNLIGWNFWAVGSGRVSSPQFIEPDGVISADNIYVDNPSLLEAMYAAALVSTDSNALEPQKSFDYTGPVDLELGTPIDEQSDITGALNRPSEYSLDGWKLWNYGAGGWVYETDGGSPKTVSVDHSVTYDEFSAVQDMIGDYRYIVIEPIWALKYKIDPQPTSDAPTVGAKETTDSGVTWNDTAAEYQWYNFRTDTYSVVKTAAAESELEAYYTERADYQDGKWETEWSETFKSAYVGFEALKGDVITVKFDTAFSGKVVETSSETGYTYNPGTDTYTYTVTEDGNVLAYLKPDNTTAASEAIFTITVTRPVVGVAVSGQNTNTLSSGIDGNQYVCKVTFENGDVLTSDAVTYTAPPTYTVTFDANGGSDVEEQTIETGNKIIEPTEPARTGYTFGGWYKETSCINAWNFENDTVSEPITLYAKWTAYEITQQPTVDNEYEVKVNPSDGVAYTWHEITETDVTMDNAEVYTYNDLPSSYNEGWWTAHSTTGMDGTPAYFYINLDAGDIVDITLSRSCTARVNIYYNNQAGQKYEDWKEIDGVSNLTLTAPGSARYYMTVSVRDSGEQPTVKAKVIKAGEAIDGQTTSKLTDGVDGTKYVAKITYPDGAVLTSDAVSYVSPSFDVTFDTDGGTTVSKQTVDNGGKVEEPAAPTKTGYTFAGWYKDSELETAWEFDTDTVTEPTTLYAKWTANTNTPYEVRYFTQTLAAAKAGNTEENDTNYTLADSETYYGTSDDTVWAERIDIEGFTKPDGKMITVSPDGTTVCDYYYARNKYGIHINDVAGISSVIGAGNYFFEEEVTISAEVEPGYKWIGWAGSINATERTYTFTMWASGGITLTPQLETKADVIIDETAQFADYDGTAKTFRIISDDALEGFTIAYEQNGQAVTPINAGFYDVVLSRAEDDTYKAYSKTLASGLIINKVVVDEPNVGDKPYNGSVQTADITDTAIYEVTENAGGTDVGTYDVILTLKDTVNYKWRMEENSGATATRKFYITFTENAWDAEPQITGWTYGQSANAPTFDAKFGEVVVEYKKTSEDETAYTTDAPVNAGIYNVRLTVTATTNFGGLSKVINLNIAKATPSLEAPTAQNSITYGAELNTVELTDGWTWLDGDTTPTVVNSGYTAYYTPADTENYDWTVINGWNATESRVEHTVAVTVTKNNPSYEAPTGLTATYGDKLADVTLPDGWSWKDTTSSVGNAGTQTFVAVFTPSDTNNYSTVEENITITVAKKEVAEPVASGSYTYTGSEQTVTLTGVESFMTVSGNKATNAGNYVVTVTLDDNHKWNALSDGIIEWSIANADMSADITADGYNAVFDNQAHTISVNIPEGASIKYGTLDGTYNLDAAPEYTNAGIYTVYYKVEKSNYNDVTGSADVVIDKKDIMNAEITLGEALTFDGDEQTQAIASATVDGLTITYDVSGNVNTNAGDYTLTITGNGNFEGTAQKTYTIARKSVEGANVGSFNALTYTGSAQTPVASVTIDGLTATGTWSNVTNVEDVTTFTASGNFTGTIANQSTGMAKATQSAPKTPAAVNETIKAKADGKITAVTSDMEYKPENASKYIAISETEIANLAAGTYLVRYKENANFLAGADKQLVIADGAMITVTFNSNEGTAVDSKTSEYNQAITAPTEPTKENFVFAGWYRDAECLDLWNFGNALTEDITLYAKWNDKPVYSVSGRVTDGESGLGGITVTLKQGNTIIATTTTAADGSYSFITEDGLYNIVAKKEENEGSTIKTVKIEVIESANVNDVVFVATDINSELEIKPDTPQIIVGGLDEEAQTVSLSNGNVDVTVKMTVESAEDITGSDDATGQEQRQNEQKEIKKVSGNRYIQFIEINLTQSISGAESTKLKETTGLIEIIIPFEKGNKRNITVYRYHGSASEKLGAGIGNANADGEYFEVKENHIVVYAKKFSTYAIGYDLPSSGGGGSSVTRYTVKFDTNGGSSVSSATVTKNAKVAEPKTPEKDGYTFGGWYTDKEFAEKYDFESKVTKNFTLYAKWNKHDDEQSSTDTHNCPSLAFDDLDITKWYHFDTDYVIENGIFKGTTETTFEPDSAQTRAMMVTVLYRAEGEPAVNRSIPFADVDMGAYYANAVIWGQQNGIIKGYSETEFGPDDKITREQIAAIMHRYAQYKGIDVSIGENTNILSYDDFDSISEYAIPSMQWAVGSGLIKGKSESTLNPLDNATRAEIAAILHRFIEANK